MNKRQLTKTFSFSKWILFFFFAVGLTLSSCGEDYDDDISNLQSQIDKLGDYQALKTKIDNLEVTLAEAKKTAEEALAAAQAAGSIDDEALQKAKQDAIDEAQARIDKVKADLEEQIKNLSGTEVTDAQLKEIIAKVKEEIDVIEADVINIVGHRLSSIEFIPDEHINGIAAIKFYSLSYIPQSFVAHSELEHTTTGAGSMITITSEEKVVRYRMNPRVGVSSEDILLPTFDCIVSTNDMTRAVNKDLAGVNTPIKPVAAGVVLENGVYELKITKTVNENINREWLNAAHDMEKFYMASLNVPIAPAHYTQEEIDNGTKPSVHSEYVRIAETTVTPFLAQAGTLSHNTSDDVHAPGTPPNIFPELNEVDTEGRWIHYHDSTSLYNSANSVLVDHVIPWDKPTDLKKLVDVCILENNHEMLENYKSYGLTFRFYLATAKYEQGGNNTDQQRFAKIESPENGILWSKVYDYNGDGGNPTQTAIGREPIVRAMLVDTVNNKLVAQRYIKLQFGEAEVDDLDPYKFPDHYVSCDTISLRFGTQEMNERVYRHIETSYGLSKTQFHSLYTGIAIDTLRQDGTIITTGNAKGEVVYVPNTYVHLSTATLQSAKNPTIADEEYSLTMLTDPNPNESYNLVWVMQPGVIGKVGTTANPRKSTYELSFRFTGAGQQSIKMKFLVDIKIPDQIFNYLGTYWKDENPKAGTGIFNVNPIVYDTPADGTAGSTIVSPVPTLRDYSHIEADLVNGWIYKNGTGEFADGTNLKPANLAQFIRMIRSCAEVKFVFDQDRFGSYSHLTGYHVHNDGVELWNTATPLVAANMTSTYLIDQTPTYNTTGDGQQDTPTDNYDYIQDNAMAASISNIFGATVLENEHNLSWNYSEILGVGGYLNSGNAGVAHAHIRLHETNKLNGTPAAIELIGKNVPVNLEVAYNQYNVIAEQKFEVHFINPLTVNGNLTGNFEDAVVNGSYLDAQKGLTFTDWNDYLVAKSIADPGETVNKNKYPWDLWVYYAVNNVVFDVNAVKTSLKWDGSVLVNDNNVTDGPTPTGVSLKQVVLPWITDPGHVNGGYWDEINYTDVSSNPTHLGYFNNGGTPVSANYWMYIPITVTYKWGVMTGDPVKVEVAKAGGTPSNP